MRALEPSMSSSPGPWSEKIVKKMMNNYLMKIVKKMMNNYLMILMPFICI